MRISSLERHDGETAEKFQSLLAPSNQSSLIQILHFALSHLSNNLLSEYATDDFLRWLIKQQQNELLVSFLKIQMPTVHACATKIFESALRIGDVDFLHLLISSGIDTSPLKGVYGSRHLICAARRGDLQIAQILLNNGADVNTPTSETYPLTALQMAAREGRDHMIQFLLEAGADINAVTMFSAYNTALSWAVFKDNTNIVRILLIEGANINICRLNGFPAIHFSARNCSNELDQLLSSECGENHLSIACKGVLKAAKGGIQALLKHLAERGEEARPPVMEVLEYALGRAVENMDHQAILSLLGIGVDPDTEMTPWLGWSRRLLQTAVESDDIESVKILVHAGADLNIPDILEAAVIAGTEMLRVMLEVGVNTETLEGALQYAADSSDLEAAEFILSYGINVNCLPGTYAPLTVLQCAVFSNNIKLVRILLDAGSDVNASIDQEGEQTALQIAVINTREVYVDLEVVQILLVAGADVNGPKSARTGASILESAIRIGNEELVQILLKEGADINSRPKGEEGRSPIQKAAERGNLYLVKLLLESGADINASAGHNRGATAIQGASFAKNPTVELIDFLLDSGADIHAPAGRDGGITALQAAAIRGHMKIALQFLEAGADVNAAAAKYNGRTALDGAAEYGRLDMVQLLLNAGACGDSTKAHRFDRAIELAQTNGHFAIAKLLEQA